MPRLFICLSLAFFSITPYGEPITIKGNIADLSSTVKVFLYDPESALNVDSATVLPDGTFSMIVHNYLPKRYYFAIEHGTLAKRLWLDASGIITIVTKKEDFVSRNLVSDEYLNFEVKSNSRSQHEEDSLYGGMKNDLVMIDTLQHVQKYYNPRTGILIDSLQALFQSKQLAFISTHPSSAFSAYMLAYYGTERSIPFRVVRKSYAKMTTVMQNSYYGLLIKRLLNYNNKPAVGQRFGDLALKDSSNQLIRLNSLKSKVTIVHFWSSQCGYAMMEAGYLHTLHHKYSKDELQTYAISLDNQTDWIGSLRADKHEWTDVMAPDGIFSLSALQYQAYYTPRNFLLNSEGIIIDTNFSLEAEASEKHSLHMIDKLLGKNNNKE
jgi:thiol-disulfide isomerase/thioredoxin